jgi:hypothetical protein
MADLANFDNPEFNFIKKLAEEYNVKVRIRPLGEGIRGYTMAGEIVLNEYSHPERRNWTFCHELGHIVHGHDTDPSQEEERIADDFAAEVMLPEADFITESKTLDLKALKDLYPHASWEVIGRRCVQFNRIIMTVFDSGNLRYRFASNGLVFPEKPTEIELDTVNKCYKTKTNLEIQSEFLNIRAYYIDEGGDVIRVILISQPDDYQD